MGCNFFLDHAGRPAVMCGEIEVKLCHVPTCGRAADYLCDHPMGAGQTCDLPMCLDHRQPVGDDLDSCMVHAGRNIRAPDVARCACDCGCAESLRRPRTLCARCAPRVCSENAPTPPRPPPGLRVIPGDA